MHPAADRRNQVTRKGINRETRTTASNLVAQRQPAPRQNYTFYALRHPISEQLLGTCSRRIRRWPGLRGVTFRVQADCFRGVSVRRQRAHSDEPSGSSPTGICPSRTGCGRRCARPAWRKISMPSAHVLHRSCTHASCGAGWRARRADGQAVRADRDLIGPSWLGQVVPGCRVGAVPQGELIADGRADLHIVGRRCVEASPAAARFGLRQVNGMPMCPGGAWRSKPVSTATAAGSPVAVRACVGSQRNGTSMHTWLNAAGTAARSGQD